MDYSFENSHSELWNYLSSPQKDLIKEGEFLIKAIIEENKLHFTDYSFLVFPFAKAYEGFLKQIFLDVGFISDADYISPHFRIGKVLSPSLVHKLENTSVYKKIEDTHGKIIADMAWNTWKRGRNEVFHYFPHNIRSLVFQEAREIIDDITRTMNQLYDHLQSEILS